MKSSLFLILFLTLIIAKPFSQTDNLTFTFSNGKIGEISLRDSVQKIHYKLIDTSSDKDYFITTYEIIPGCAIRVFYQNSSYISELETDCEKIKLENGIHAGMKVRDINKLDTAFTLALGEKFGFVKFDKSCSCHISLLLGDKAMNDFWASYNLNMDKCQRMEDFLDQNAVIWKIHISSITQSIK